MGTIYWHIYLEKMLELLSEDDAERFVEEHFDLVLEHEARCEDRL